jgi:hypothetical protein
MCISRETNGIFDEAYTKHAQDMFSPQVKIKSLIREWLNNFFLNLGKS